MEYYIYILRCEDNSLYTGITKNLELRYNKHIEGKGAKYTRIHKPKKIEVYFLCKNRSEATIIEKYIKNISKVEKENYIKNPSLFKENILKIKGIKIF